MRDPASPDAVLCKADKEQLNRIEEMLKELTQRPERRSLLPRCNQVGAQCGDPQCDRGVVMTAPGKWEHSAIL